MPITGWSEYDSFVSKAKLKLGYYDTVALFINDEIWYNKIYRDELFQFNHNRPIDSIHLCLKDVVYTLDYSKLGISPIKLPIALRFNIDSGIIPTPSREDILYSPSTVALIKERIDKVCHFIYDKYKSEIKTVDTLVGSKDNLFHPKRLLIIEEVSFNLDSLFEYLKVSPSSWKLSYLKHFDAFSLKNQVKYHFDSVINQKIWYSNGSTRRKVYDSVFLGIVNSNRVYIVSNKPVGTRTLDFLRNKYKDFSIISYNFKPRLFKSKEHPDNFYYRKVELINLKNKSLWREIIKEHQQIFKDLSSVFIQLTDIENEQEYIDFINKDINNKREARKKRLLESKQALIDGEIELRTRGEKGTNVNMSDLISYKKFKGLRVGLPLSSESYKKIKVLTGFPKLHIYALSQQHFKLAKQANFITWSEFMKHKKFKKIVTTYRANIVLNLVKKISDFSKENSFFSKFLTNKSCLIADIQLYVNQNRYWGIDDDLNQEMYEIALVNNTFDESIIDKIKQLEQLEKDLGFMKYLRLNFSTEEQKKESMSIVYKLLYYEKTMNQKLEGYELELKPIEEKKKELSTTGI